MKRLQKHYPYVVGLLVGFFIVPTFALGFNAGFGRFSVLGDVLMVTALLLWPALIVLVIVLHVFVYGTEEATRKKQWQRTLFLPPLGAVLSLAFLAVLYSIIG